jgi:hypothetical protein
MLERGGSNHLRTSCHEANVGVLGNGGEVEVVGVVSTYIYERSSGNLDIGHKILRCLKGTSGKEVVICKEWTS